MMPRRSLTKERMTRTNANMKRSGQRRAMYALMLCVCTANSQSTQDVPGAAGLKRDFSQSWSALSSQATSSLSATTRTSRRRLKDTCIPRSCGSLPWQSNRDSSDRCLALKADNGSLTVLESVIRAMMQYQLLMQGLKKSCSTFYGWSHVL
eukprot:295006-Amphidinium_carterae.2